MTSATLPQDAPQAAEAVWTCQSCGQELDGACSQPTRSCRIDAEMVTARLEHAGQTLLALRAPSPWPQSYRCAMPEVMHQAILAYGYTSEAVRPAIPDANAISRMDQAWKWLQLIPQARFVLRRVVAARSLVNPVSGRHVLGWRHLGRVIHADHHAAQRWHSQGIDIIVEGLNR